MPYLSVDGVPLCQAHLETHILKHLMAKHGRLDQKRTEQFCPYGDEACSAGKTCARCWAFFNEANNFFRDSFQCVYTDRGEAEAARRTILRYTEQFGVQNIEVVDGNCPAYASPAQDESN